MAETKQGWKRAGSISLLMVVAVSLFLAESAYWINHTIFSKQSFTSITTTALQREDSREAIASSIVHKTLEDRPIVQRLIGERAISFTTGLLGSDVSTQAIQTVTDKTYGYVTSPTREDIKLDLTTVNTALDTLISLAETQGKGDRLVAVESTIPQDIVLVESQTFPDVSGVVKTMLWVGPVLWLAFIASAGTYVYLGRREYARRVYTLVFVIMAVALLGLFMMPFIPTALATTLPGIELRPVAENLALGLLAPFRGQMVVLLVLAVLAVILFSQRMAILRGAQRLSTKLAGSSVKDKPAPQRPNKKPPKT